jgi:hypothetical protein
MNVLREMVESIVDRDGWTAKEKIDELFRIDCRLYTNLGIDSTDQERDIVRKTSRYIYEKIQTIDKNIGDQLLKSIDL